jgi:hypothetical protein
MQPIQSLSAEAAAERIGGPLPAGVRATEGMP